MKLNSFGMKLHPKRYENTLIEGMKIHLKGMKMMSKVRKNTNDTKVQPIPAYMIVPTGTIYITITGTMVD